MYNKQKGVIMKTICNKCGSNEGILLKEFDSNKSYFWSELSDMTEVCASCGSEDLKELK